MSNAYYIMASPLIMDATEKIGVQDFSPLQLAAEFSNNSHVQLDEHNYLDFLRFDLSKELALYTPTSFTCTSYYIANQLAKAEPEAKVYIADGKKCTIVDVIEKESEKPKAVFISCMSAMFPAAVATTVALNYAKIPVIIGGVHTSSSPDDVELYIKKYVPSPNLVSQVRGAGTSKVINDVVVDINNHSIKEEYVGKQFLENGVWGSSNVILPDFGSGSRANYVAPILGCPYSCSYCSLGALPKDQRKLVTRNPVDFVNELKEFQKESATKNRVFYFVPDNLLMGGKKVEEMADIIIESGIKINYSTLISIDIADKPELLKKLRLSGAYHFSIGLESLDIRNLEFMNKNSVKAMKKNGQSPAEYYTEKVKKIQEHGIAVQGNFIFGFPYDYFNSLEDHSGKEVVEFSNKNNIIAIPNSLVDLPGSKNFHDNQASGMYPYKPGSIDYLLNLTTCNMFEGNDSKLVPDSLHNSSLVPFYMLYYVLKNTKNAAAITRNLWYYAKKSWKAPTYNGNLSRKERLLDTSVSMALVLGEKIISGRAYKSVINSTNGRKGVFEKHFDAEKNPELKNMFSGFIKQFIKHEHKYVKN